MRSTPSHIDKYELRSVLAKTATSVVYDGWDSDIARRVAIKTVPLSTIEDDEAAEALARFKRGVQAAGKLTHPNVMSVYDYGETDEYAYIVMEFIDGPTLKQVLDGGKHFDLPAICKMMEEILSGLQYSHDHAVVHRDMKPANIMLTKDERLKITDFGIARLENNNLTQAGMVIGTPAYMSPEQFMGEEVDWRSDIYSVGVILYQMITGARPYEGTYTTIMHKVLNAPVPRPSVLFPSISPALDQVVMRAMAKVPEKRFQSAAEFNAALRAVKLHAEPPIRPLTAPRPEPGVPLRQMRRSYSWLGPAMTGAAVALVIVAGVGVGLYWHGKSSSDPEAAAQQQVADYRQKLASVTTAQSQPPVTPSTPPVRDSAPPTDQTPRPDSGTANTGSANAGSANSGISNVPPSDRVTTDTSQDINPQPRPQTGGSIDNALTALPQAPAPEPLPSIPAPPPQPPPSRVQKSEPAPRPAPPREKPPSRVAKPAEAPPKPVERKGDVRTADTGESVQDVVKRLKQPNTPQTDNPPAQTLPAGPASYPVTSLSSNLGLLCRSLTPEKAQEMGINQTTGMLVMGVTAGSPAALAGVRANDVILKVNGSEMQNLSDIRATAGQAIPIEVFRNRKVIQLMLGAAS